MSENATRNKKEVSEEKLLTLETLNTHRQYKTASPTVIKKKNSRMPSGNILTNQV